MTQKSSKSSQREGKAWGSHHPPRLRLSILPSVTHHPGSAVPGITPGTCWPLLPMGGIEGAGPSRELAAPTLPDGTLVRVVHLIALHGVGVGVTGALLLVPHGVLVDGGVGLGGGVVRRRDAVAGLTAVIAVPVVHHAVGVIICKGLW